MSLALYILVAPLLAAVSGVGFWAMVVLCNRRLPDRETANIHLPPGRDSRGEKKIQRALPSRQTGTVVGPFLCGNRDCVPRCRFENLAAVAGRLSVHLPGQSVHN